MSEQGVEIRESWKPKDVFNREKLYLKIKELLPESPVIYYPGSGADPVPFNIFGSKVIYGSLREADYFGFVKKKNLPEAHRQTPLARDTKEFEPIYADVNNNPFRKGYVDLVIFHNFPGVIDERMAEELKRIVKPGGMVIYDRDEVVSDQEESVRAILDKGFAPHFLDIGPEVIDGQKVSVSRMENGKIVTKRKQLVGRQVRVLKRMED